MEKSKRKLANTMLYYVIILCIAAIITVTLFTASKKAETSTVDSTDLSTIQSAESTEKIPEKQTKTTSSTSSVTESVTTEKSTETKAPETAKTDVQPQKVIHKSPVNGYVGKEYSIDVPVYSLTMNDYRAHTGIDLVCNEGSPVCATAAGVIKGISVDPMMGTTVIVDHTDGITTYYMNLNETLPNDIVSGAKVNAGQLIGAVGTSAITEIAQEPHLHLEMTVSGAYIDPITVLDMSSVSVISDNVIE